MFSSLSSIKCIFSYLQRLLCLPRVQRLQRVRLLRQDLHGGVLVDRDGSGGDEELLLPPVLLEDGHHSGLEDGQGGHVLREDAEGAGEGRNVHLKRNNKIVRVILPYLNKLAI